MICIIKYIFKNMIDIIITLPTLITLRYVLDITSVLYFTSKDANENVLVN